MKHELGAGDLSRVHDRAILPVGTAEGFLVDGGRVCFTDATFRPADARIGPMLGFSHDVDLYPVWARVAMDGSFDGP
jgi:hypothetical protein